MSITGVTQAGASCGTKATSGTEAVQSSSSKPRTGNDYLNELKSRFPGANFSVGDFGSRDELKSYAMGKIGSFNDVVISSQALEKFASDPEAAAKMEKEIQASLDYGREVKGKTFVEGGRTRKIMAAGMVVDKDGNVSGWAISQSETISEGDSGMEKMRKKLEERLMFTVTNSIDALELRLSMGADETGTLDVLV